MWNRLKSYSLVASLFVFLFVVIGAGLHLNPMGALAAALSGTALVLHGVKRRSGARSPFLRRGFQEEYKGIYELDPFAVCAICGQAYVRDSRKGEAWPNKQTNGSKTSTFKAVR